MYLNRCNWSFIDNLVSNVQLNDSGSNNDVNRDTGATCYDINDKSGKIDDVIRLKSSLIEDVFDRFFNFINTAIEIYVPSLVVNHDATYPAWFNQELTQLTQLKKSYHAAWQKFPEDEKLHESFKKTRAKCSYLSKSLHAQYLLDVQKSIKTNIKFYWKYVNSLKSNKSATFPRCMNLNDSESNSDFESSNLFQKFFSLYRFDINLIN